MPKKGFFLTLEGTDGVGKTTHARLLEPWLQRVGWETVLTREPGAGGGAAERIRHLLLDPGLTIQPLTELFLYEAARVEHLANVVRPALERGAFIVCDRFTDATLAYQGFARGLTEARFLNTIATSGLRPDLTVLLELPADVALGKATARGAGGDRLEREGNLFQRRVRKGYLSIARKEPGRVKIVRVADDVHETQNRIRAVIEKRLHGNPRTRTRTPLPR